MKKKPKFLAFDFFCGAGGMTHGLIQAGFHVVAGIDNETACETTYSQNRNADRSRPAFLCHNIFPRSRYHPDGEQQVLAEKIEELLRKFGPPTRRPKLVFAICAPCQPFTKITRFEMSETRQFRRANDANLLLTTLRLIEQFRPNAIICENVEGIIDGKSDSVLGQFRLQLKKLGYEFDAKVINAANFGIAQNRKRTIGIALDRQRHDAPLEIALADASVRRRPTVAEVIGHLPPVAAGESHPRIKNHRARTLNDLNLKRISCALPGESNHYLRDTPYGDLSLKCHRDLEERAGAQSFADTYTRMRGDDIAPTITTKCISITNGRFGHYDTNQHRGLTPREAALLQTFPESYVFFPEDNISFAATLIGNAVPPKLARFYGRYLIDVLSRRRRKGARNVSTRKRRA